MKNKLFILPLIFSLLALSYVSAPANNQSPTQSWHCKSSSESALYEISEFHFEIQGNFDPFLNTFSAENAKGDLLNAHHQKVSLSTLKKPRSFAQGITELLVKNQTGNDPIALKIVLIDRESATELESKGNNASPPYAFISEPLQAHDFQNLYICHVHRSYLRKADTLVHPGSL